MTSSVSNRITVALLKLIPARLMGRVIYRLSRSERQWLKNRLILWFSWFYKVNTSEADKPVPAGYKSFNEFFTRKLSTGSRPIHSDPDSIISPADGTIAQIAVADGQQLIQAKGMNFQMSDLLGDVAMADELANCAYTTVYLAPYNYHRLHMPLLGTLDKTLFIPGLLYSVNAATTATVPNLYALNERLVCFFRGPQGPFAMVLVGAMNVASISTVWCGEITPPADAQIVETIYSDTGNRPELSKGDYMGHFNMGSTVVLLTPPDVCTWLPQLKVNDIVRVGQQLGVVDI